MKKFITLLCFFLLVASCAHYERTWTKKYHQKLETETLTSIEGSYQITPYQYFFRDSIAVVPANRYSTTLLTNHLRMSEVPIDTSRHYRLELKLLNTRLLQTQLFENDSVISAHILKGKLRNNGTFHLSDKINDAWGIPFLIGGHSQKKTRIGNTTDGELFVQSAYYSGGALLLIFGDMRGYNDVLSYQKINPKTVE